MAAVIKKPSTVVKKVATVFKAKTLDEKKFAQEFSNYQDELLSKLEETKSAISRKDELIAEKMKQIEELKKNGAIETPERDSPGALRLKIARLETLCQQKEEKVKRQAREVELRKRHSLTAKAVADWHADLAFQADKLEKKVSLLQDRKQKIDDLRQQIAEREANIEKITSGPEKEQEEMEKSLQEHEDHVQKLRAELVVARQISASVSNSRVPSAAPSRSASRTNSRMASDDDVEVDGELDTANVEAEPFVSDYPLDEKELASEIEKKKKVVDAAKAILTSIRREMEASRVPYDSPYHIAIEETRENTSSSKQFTEYLVSVEHEGSRYTVARRFNSFRKLHFTLQAQFSGTELPMLPWRSLFPADKPVVEYRMVMLQEYLLMLVGNKQFATSEALQTFLSDSVDTMMSDTDGDTIFTPKTNDINLSLTMSSPEKEASGDLPPASPTEAER